MAALSKKSSASRLTLQQLEGREVPAGLVTGSVVNGVLTLTGDDLANNIGLTDTGAGMTVTGFAGTQIKLGNAVGDAQAFQNVTAVKLVMKGENDTVSLAAGSALKLAGAFTADMGAGDNFLTLSSGAANPTVGSLSYTGGAGKDTVQFGAAFLPGTTTVGAVTFNMGAGDNIADINNAAVAGGILYTGADNGDELSLSDTTVQQNVTFNAGKSFADVGGNNLTLDGVTVTGNVSASGGSGLNFFGVTGAPVVVNGAAGITLTGAGAGSGWTSYINSPLTVANGGFAATGTGGVSYFVLNAAASVKKAISVSDAYVRMDGHNVLTAGGVTLTGTDQAHLTQDGQAVFVGDVNVTATAGAADAKFDGPFTVFNAALKVASVNGPAKATFLSDVVNVKGLTTVSGGSAADLDDWTVNGATFGAVNVTSAKGKANFSQKGDGLLTLNGKLTVTGAQGAAASLTGAKSKSLKDVSVAGGAGTAYLHVDGGKTAIDGAVTVTGASTDVLLDGNDAGSHIAKTLTVTGGAGADAFWQRGGFHVAGHATLTLGNGAADVRLGGAGGLSAVSNLTVTTGTGDDTVEFYNFHVNGTASVKTGDGADNVYLTDTTFNATFALYTGAGKDLLAICLYDSANAPVTFAGKATIKLGSGDDILLMGKPGNDADKAVFLTAGSTIDGGADYDMYKSFEGQGHNTPNLTLTTFEPYV